MKTILNPDNFKGKVMQRTKKNGGISEWTASAYQYAYTSVDDVEEKCDPAYIIYAQCDQDIFEAMNYASQNDLGIAVRSGGHQYNAASSTYGDNIQLDLSGKESESPVYFTQASVETIDDNKILTVGCGVALSIISDLMNENNTFFPRGECSTVHFGGHSNTGGMSVITPYFGAMIDHIIEFDFICNYYLTKKTVVRPDLWNDKSDIKSKEENDEIFWAVLGGSPGNFGIITQAKIKCLNNSDYPHSRGMKLAWPYSPETVEAIAKIVCDVCDDKELASSISISSIIIGPEYFYPYRNPSAPKVDLGSLTIDDQMLKNYPKLAGLNKFNYVGGHGMVAVYGAFLNPTGATGYEGQLAAFEAIRNKLLKIHGCISPKLFPIVNDVLKGVFDIASYVEKHLFNNPEKAKKIEEFHESLSLDDLMFGEKYEPISQILSKMSWDNPREFSLSYKKLSYIGNSISMSKQNNKLKDLPVMKGCSTDQLTFSTWLSKELEHVLSNPNGNPGMYFAVQFGTIGGPGLKDPSRFGGKASNTSLAHRDSNFWFDYDVFYNPTIKDCTEKTTEYINSVAKLVVNNTLNLFKTDKQQRVLLGPSFPLGEQPILDYYWEYFYNDENDYSKLCNLKKKYDDKNIFTSNLMSIGATKVDRMQDLLRKMIEKEEIEKQKV